MKRIKEMNKIKIGILCPSDIAFRRFLPAIKSSDKFDYIGVAIARADEWSKDMDDRIYASILEREKTKTNNFCTNFGGKIFYSYENLLMSDEIEAIYIPLPPELHYRWAKLALEYGKHVLLEKPFTTNLTNTKEIIELAKKSNLALHENYAFCFHNQVKRIQKMLDSGEIGELRQIRAAFGFPYRGAVDFRYNKKFGGGALLDCAGYPVKLASLLLGETTKVVAGSLKSAKGHDVDVFGSATLINNEHITCQVTFGMDNSYKCELEVWGSEGCIFAPRIFTPPADMKPTIVIKKKDKTAIETPMDDQFLGSVEHFYSCVSDVSIRRKTFRGIERQSKMIDNIRTLSSKIKMINSEQKQNWEE